LQQFQDGQLRKIGLYVSIHGKDMLFAIDAAFVVTTAGMTATTTPLARRAVPVPIGRIRPDHAADREPAQTVIKTGARKAALQGL
jgi:hypothetical protein